MESENKADKITHNEKEGIISKPAVHTTYVLKLKKIKKDVLVTYWLYANDLAQQAPLKHFIAFSYSSFSLLSLGP
jgi:hypothetical protein